MTDKEIYRNFCKNEPSIPLFCKDWWLDAVCGENGWDVAVVQKGGKIVATMPYHIRKQWGMTSIRMPNLTQTMGPWLAESNSKYEKKLSQQKNVMTELIKKLPPFDRFRQNFHNSISNWLPFFWHQFEQTTRYTYVIEDLRNTEKIWDGLNSRVIRNIKKAKKRFGIQVCTDLGIDVFLDLNEMTFSRQNISLPYTRDFVHRLDSACVAHNARKSFFGKDDKGKIHAAVYIVWDEDSAYYLMGGSDPSLRKSEANSLCMWSAIKFASTVTKKFDFEGSMIESVERYFRSFGARQIPYFQLEKTNSRLLQIYRDVRSWAKKSS
jgi:hypothetical protein